MKGIKEIHEYRGGKILQNNPQKCRGGVGGLKIGRVQISWAHEGEQKLFYDLGAYFLKIIVVASLHNACCLLSTSKTHVFFLFFPAN